MSKPSVWTVLRNEDGDEAIVVPGEDTPVVDALLHLVHETYGDDPAFSSGNPALIEAAKGCRVERWHSCTKAWRDANNVYEFDDYWAPDGDGARSIFIVSYDGRGYDLGKEADQVARLSPKDRTLTGITAQKEALRERSDG